MNDLLSEGPKVINIGLRSFYEASETQGIKVVHIDWKPPAQGDIETIKLLDRLL